MGRRGDSSNALLCGKRQDLHTLLQGAGAVVQAGQDVRVQVDHSVNVAEQSLRAVQPKGQTPKGV
jgi:hypothetical protein